MSDEETKPLTEGLTTSIDVVSRISLGIIDRSILRVERKTLVFKDGLLVEVVSSGYPEELGPIAGTFS